MEGEGKLTTKSFPEIPGAEIHEGKLPGSSEGVFIHTIIASKNHIVMDVDYLNDSATRPPLVGNLARQQYARL
jgi:hypothetical protein